MPGYARPLNPSGSRGVFEEEASSEEAFDAFVTETYGRIVGAVRMIVRDHAGAEDITQEAFARAYINWPKLYPDGNPGGWVYRVATNLALSKRRSAVREIRAVTRLSRWTEQTTPGPEAYPELHAAVAKLPPRQRAAVALHYVLGCSMEECAEAMKCKSGTVKSLLHAARERIRNELGDQTDNS